MDSKNNQVSWVRLAIGSMGVVAIALGAGYYVFAAPFVDDFEEYALGNLDGQGDWRKSDFGSTSYQVLEDEHCFSGVRCIRGGIGQSSIHRVLPVSNPDVLEESFMFRPVDATGSTLFAGGSTANGNLHRVWSLNWDRTRGAFVIQGTGCMSEQRPWDNGRHRVGFWYRVQLRWDKQAETLAFSIHRHGSQVEDSYTATCAFAPGEVNYFHILTDASGDTALIDSFGIDEPIFAPVGSLTDDFESHALGIIDGQGRWFRSGFTSFHNNVVTNPVCNGQCLGANELDQQGGSGYEVGDPDTWVQSWRVFKIGGSSALTFTGTVTTNGNTSRAWAFTVGGSFGSFSCQGGSVIDPFSSTDHPSGHWYDVAVVWTKSPATFRVKIRKEGDATVDEVSPPCGALENAFNYQHALDFRFGPLVDDYVPYDFADPPLTHEQLLAEKFKPVLYLHEDEKYAPQEIQVVLDTADLYKDDTLVQSTPPALSSDLIAASTDSDYKLDLDGDRFIEISPITGEPYKNTAYAHITQDQGHVVLQYWFFYYFNDWQGAPVGLDFTHEGDWEFVQLIFPKDKTIEQIVDENIPPDQAVYSAHLGGYSAEWPIIEKENNRPIVYVAQGSHANHFRPGVCDITQPRGDGTDVATSYQTFDIENSQPIIDPIDTPQFQWLLFGGLWGNDNTSNKHSPDTPLNQTVPLTKENKWFTPISWSNARLGGVSPLVVNWVDFYLDHCDGDFDGIWNNADPDKENLSNDFAAPGPFGTETKGAITERGDREFKIKDFEVGGVHFEATPGNQIAIIELDGILCIPQSTIIFKPSSERTFGIATCLSTEIFIEDGSVDFIASHNGIEIVATVGPNQTVHYAIVDDQLHIETSGAGEIPLTINGKPATIQAGETTLVIEVLIDIKPDSDRNRINCKKPKQLIPVSILSTDTFDANTVDHTTVLFEGANEFHKDKKTGQPKRHGGDDDEDEDEDDLIFHFRLGDTTLTCESTEATLTGRTFSGDLLIGTDSIDTKTR